eukprot:15477055-Alexandrium_andersonii.AAC.1
MSPKTSRITKTTSMFAARPPLEALRLLLSDLATRRRGRERGRRRGACEALLIDVRKAHTLMSMRM